MFDVKPSPGSAKSRSLIAEVGRQRLDGFDLVDIDSSASATVLPRLGGCVRSLRRGLREELTPVDDGDRALPVGFSPTFASGKLGGTLTETIRLDELSYNPAGTCEVLGLARDDAAMITLRPATAPSSDFEVELAYRLQGDCVRMEISYRSTAREIIRVLPGLRWVLEPRVTGQFSIECEAESPMNRWTSYADPTRIPGPTIEVAGDRDLCFERPVQSLRWEGGGLRIRSSPEYRQWRVITNSQKDLGLLEARACATGNGGFAVPLLLQPGEVRSTWCEFRLLAS